MYVWYELRITVCCRAILAGIRPSLTKHVAYGKSLYTDSPREVQNESGVARSRPCPGFALLG